MKLLASRLVETTDARVRVRVDLEGGAADWHLVLVPLAQDSTGSWVETEEPSAVAVGLVDDLAEHLAELSPDLQESFVRGNVQQRRMRAWLRKWEVVGRTDRREGIRVEG